MGQFGDADSIRDNIDHHSDIGLFIKRNVHGDSSDVRSCFKHYKFFGNLDRKWIELYFDC